MFLPSLFLLPLPFLLGKGNPFEGGRLSGIYPSGDGVRVFTPTGMILGASSAWIPWVLESEIVIMSSSVFCYYSISIAASILLRNSLDGWALNPNNLLGGWKCYCLDHIYKPLWWLGRWMLSWWLFLFTLFIVAASPRFLLSLF